VQDEIALPGNELPDFDPIKAGERIDVVVVLRLDGAGVVEEAFHGGFDRGRRGQQG
jgi:hypothetical protein